jgi:NADH-quinone oxidoreductase subunit H
MYALIFTVIWIRWTFPRTQFYGLLNLSWKILIPVSLFTLLLTSAMMKLPLLCSEPMNESRI